MLQIEQQKKMEGERFHVKKAALSISTEKVNLELMPGETKEGSFVVQSGSGNPVSGTVISRESPMKVLTSSFFGMKEEISYSFCAESFAPGDKEEGEFCILSSEGEYVIPFTVVIRGKNLDSSLGPVRNLMHFTNLARSSWQEAVKIFYQNEFREVLNEEDPSLDLLYRGLSAREGNEHNVEEFLICAGRKKPAVFSFDRTEVSVDLQGNDLRKVMELVRIRRSGWGYTRLCVEVSGDFLSPGKRTLYDSDFVNGTAELSLIIDPARLHAGRNYGEITVKPAFGDAMKLAVTVDYNRNNALRSLREKEQKQIIVQMMKAYISFRARHSSAEEFAQTMRPLIQKLKDSDRNNPITSLYEIHYLLTVSKSEDAKWELKALCQTLSGFDDPLPDYSLAQFDLEDDVTYAYRLYLSILCAQQNAQEGEEEEVQGLAEDAARTIGLLHRRNPSNFWIAWLLLYTDPSYHRSPSREGNLLVEQYSLGCRSPILYMEYWQMIRISPTILRELGDFELQVLYFAAKNEMLTDSVMTRVNDLAVRRKTFSRRLYEILQLAWNQDLAEPVKDRTLESICTLLIRGNMTGEDSFVWYQRGVDKGLGITRLLDYYMLSLPLNYEGELPQIVLRYFSYQSVLPEAKSAYLYRYILEHMGDYPELYEQYAERIHAFTEEQLRQRRISKDLGVLYRHYLVSGNALSEEMTEAFAEAVYSCRLETKQTDYARAVLIYTSLNSEQYCPLKDGVGWLSVYGSDNQIFLENDEGDRITGKEIISLEHMMDETYLTAFLAPYQTENLKFEMVRLEAEKKNFKITKVNAGRCLWLVLNTEITQEFRVKLGKALLSYEEEAGDFENSILLLNHMDPAGIGQKTRGEFLDFMAALGMYEQAYSWIAQFGTSGVNEKSLLKMASGMIQENDGSEDAVILSIAYKAFTKGEYDSTTLDYLSSNWDGTTNELGEIRTAVLNFESDAYLVSRRMLMQMLYTGETCSERSELVMCCKEAGEGSEFLSNVLAQSSHFYFIDQKPMLDSEFSLIGEYGMEGIPLLDICRIAWLKDESLASGEVSEQNQEITELFLKDLLGRGIVFPFFRQFSSSVAMQQSYADETLVEYRTSETKPTGKVLLHYTMERDGERTQYQVRRMKEMYDGVYVAGFILFFGEELHYYITDDPLEKNVTESGTLGQDARIVSQGEDRFSEVNEIVMLTALGRDEEALVKMEEYGRKAFLTDALFKES